MLFDWFTVSAQILNFIILVWALKRFLYQPILHAIDDREKKIDTELKEAKAMKSETQKEYDEFNTKKMEFEKNSESLINKAKDDANIERQRLFDEARKDVEVMKVKQKGKLENASKKLNQTIAMQIQQEVFSIARKLLRDLANTEMENLMGELFIQRLRDQDQKSREKIIETLSNVTEGIKISSAKSLESELQSKIKNALFEIFNIEISDDYIKFEVEANLIGGIELVASGHKIAWSVEANLKQLEQTVSDIINKPIENIPEEMVNDEI